MENSERQQPGIEEMLDIQLQSLYAEKEILEQKIGTSDPESIVNMIRSMQSQLEELYAWKESFQTLDITQLKISGDKKIFYRKEQ